jgi:hypothetical protein
MHITKSGSWNSHSHASSWNRFHDPFQPQSEANILLHVTAKGMHKLTGKDSLGIELFSVILHSCKDFFYKNAQYSLE